MKCLTARRQLLHPRQRARISRHRRRGISHHSRITCRATSLRLPRPSQRLSTSQSLPLSHSALLRIPRSIPKLWFGNAPFQGCLSSHIVLFRPRQASASPRPARHQAAPAPQPPLTSRPRLNIKPRPQRHLSTPSQFQSA
jgi:hypothetical protein